MDLTNILAQNNYNFTARTYPGREVGGKKIRREIKFYNTKEEATGYVLFFDDMTVSYNVKKGRKTRKDFFSPNTENRMNRVSRLLFDCNYNDHTKPKKLGRERISSFG